MFEKNINQEKISQIVQVFDDDNECAMSTFLILAKVTMLQENSSVLNSTQEKLENELKSDKEV